jgi:hypothetical protein
VIGPFLNAFEFRGAGAVQGLLDGPSSGALSDRQTALARQSTASLRAAMAAVRPADGIVVAPPMNYALSPNCASGCEPATYGSRKAGSFAISTAISCRRRPLRRCERGPLPLAIETDFDTFIEVAAPGSTPRSSR